jgi:hypothetical protein
MARQIRKIETRNCFKNGARGEFVLSHPSRDKTAARMGHPEFLLGVRYPEFLLGARNPERCWALVLLGRIGGRVVIRRFAPG